MLYLCTSLKDHQLCFSRRYCHTWVMSCHCWSWQCFSLCFRSIYISILIQRMVRCSNSLPLFENTKHAYRWNLRSLLLILLNVFLRYHSVLGNDGLKHGCFRKCCSSYLTKELNHLIFILPKNLGCVLCTLMLCALCWSVVVLCIDHCNKVKTAQQYHRISPFSLEYSGDMIWFGTIIKITINDAALKFSNSFQSKESCKLN